MNEESERSVIRRLSRSVSGLNGISILIFLILIVGIILLPLYPVYVHFEREGDGVFAGGYYTAFPVGTVIANDFEWDESETWMEGSSSVVQETDYVTTPVWGILYVPYVMVAYFVSRIPKYLLEKRRGGTKSLEGRSDR